MALIAATIAAWSLNDTMNENKGQHYVIVNM